MGPHEDLPGHRGAGRDPEGGGGRPHRWRHHQPLPPGQGRGRPGARGALPGDLPPGGRPHLRGGGGHRRRRDGVGGRETGRPPREHRGEGPPHRGGAPGLPVPHGSGDPGERDPLLLRRAGPPGRQGGGHLHLALRGSSGRRGPRRHGGGGRDPGGLRHVRVRDRDPGGLPPPPPARPGGHEGGRGRGHPPPLGPVPAHAPPPHRQRARGVPPGLEGSRPVPQTAGPPPHRIPRRRTVPWRRFPWPVPSPRPRPTPHGSRPWS